jgi:hypothetical protein
VNIASVPLPRLPADAFVDDAKASGVARPAGLLQIRIAAGRSPIFGAGGIHLFIILFWGPRFKEEMRLAGTN